MSVAQLVAESIALPLPERVALAQALWQSIHKDLPESNEQEALSEAIRRDEELTSGAIVGRSHAEVMRAARDAIGCG